MEVKANYLNGQWVGSEESIDVVNPATGQVFAKVAAVSREQVRRALTDAQAAFNGWRALPAKARADYLLAIAAEKGPTTFPDPFSAAAAARCVIRAGAISQARAAQRPRPGCSQSRIIRGQ